MAAAAEAVGDVVAALGGGPYWVPEDDCLLWADMRGGLLHRTYFPSGDTATVGLGELAAAFPAAGGGILAVGGTALTLRLPAERGADWTARTVAEIPAGDSARFSGAGVDPHGRIWAGSALAGEPGPTAGADWFGALYRLGPDGLLAAVVRSVRMPAGIAWSPEGTRMYCADSPSRRVDVFDYNPVTGAALRRRVFADLSGAQGVPGGLAADADGFVWVAMRGGHALRRLAPTGAEDAIVPLPVSRPTGCAFGGLGMSDLYVTTASAGAVAEPLAGRLLRLRPGPVGLPAATTKAVIPARPLSAFLKRELR